MQSMAETDAAFSGDISKMSKVEKLAALLIVLGPESAAQILKSLEEHEMQMISGAMAKIPMISHDVQVEILREFSEVAVQASTSLRGGIEFTQSVLEKVIGTNRASEIMGRTAPVRKDVSAVQQFVEKDARQIFNVIKSEQPQTIALVVSFLPPQKASEVLMQLAAEPREQVIERLATLAPTPIEVVEKLGEILIRRIGTQSTRAMNQSGGVKPTATVLNAMNKELSKSILGSLEQRNPELTKAIRHKMFTFEDLAKLDKTSLQKILREVDLRNLATALKSSSDLVKSALLSCVSKRAAETVNEEISFMGSVKAREVEAAQFSVIEIARKLEADGEIELGTAPAAQTA
jgi:flagellar motor switch protein FliG